MLPLVKRLADGKERKLSDLVGELGSNFGLTEEELSQLLPSGAPIFANRVAWARLHLKRRHCWTLLSADSCRSREGGKRFFRRAMSELIQKFLERFPEYVAFKQRDSTAAAGPLSVPSTPSTLSSTPFEKQAHN
jgi:restriction system protein